MDKETLENPYPNFSVYKICCYSKVAVIFDFMVYFTFSQCFCCNILHDLFSMNDMSLLTVHSLLVFVIFLCEDNV